MNIFSKALDTIKFKIPREVLRVAFQEDQVFWREAPPSLDDLIMRRVIKPRVLIDANIVGGTQVIISLEGLTPVYTDSYTLVYEVPLVRTNNREIVSVLSIGYLPYVSTFNSMGYGMGTVTPNSMNDIDSAGQRVGDSLSNVPPISNASVELVGANTIMIRDQLRVTNAYQLRCMLANESNLNNINPRSYLHFAELCVLAVKAHIYTTLLIKLDQAYLQGGQELGSIKAYVESLSDANENYDTYLREVWQKTAVMSDRPTHHRFLKTMVSPGV